MDAPLTQQQSLKNEWVTRVLGIPIGSALAASTDTPQFDPALLSKAVAAWTATLTKIDREIDALRSAIVGTYAERGLGPALAAAYETMVAKGIAERNGTLMDVLKALQATDPASPRLNVRLEAARDAIDDLQDFVNGNPVIEGLDNNPFGIALSVRATVTGSLKAIAKIIG